MIRFLFAVAALYDGALGLIALLAGVQLYRLFGVTPPNHWGYVQFPGALLVVFAIMFVAIARDPARNRGLIAYGMLLKASYCGVIFFYWFTAGLPDMWKPFAICDAIFFVLFAWAYLSLEPRVG